MKLARRLDRLERELAAELDEPLPEVAPEWQVLARSDPELHANAVALASRQKELWPDREPSEEEFLEDTECREHWLRLACAKEGGLANLLALGFD